ncbi:CoA-binding protein [Petrocella atlantisensis]|uniref:CoA-binding protein n=1 Tax=Petrocella atlantisensis TaxID=2173034 RepID=A0A3P7PZH2_9FIRM|nr:CoA-binding protein [Petrocella atlantisensis]MCF8018684.1 CoA-binding protein [Vallitaleaceae bacterium]VDN48947.1 CoA-binding protein [Petrocella atlantisensis]
MSQHEWLEYKNWAVIGASEKNRSYGRKITQRLLDEGYNVIPVSRNYDTILGEKSYQKLTEYDGPIDVVDFVISPSIGIRILDDVIEKGIKKILLQPGSASAALIQKAKNHDIEVLESCVLVLLSEK